MFIYQHIKDWLVSFAWSRLKAKGSAGRAEGFDQANETTTGQKRLVQVIEQIGELRKI